MLEKESKSKRKANMLALQKIGESLIKLTVEQLGQINLPDNLLVAIQHSKSLTSHEAIRRQLQYIGKLMREIDPEAITQVLKQVQLVHEKNTLRFKKIEEWRSQLIAHGDDMLHSFLQEHPEIESDRQQLRQLIRKAQQDRKNNKNTGAETALFKYLRSVLEKKW